jgi:ABC-type amino acid transport substrate-binding protein
MKIQGAIKIAGVYWVLTLVGFCLSAGPAMGAYNTTKGELKIALFGNYMPLHGVYGKVMIGFEAEFAELLAFEMKKNITFVHTKRMSSIAAVKLGKVDVSLNSITPTAERSRLVGFTEPYVILDYRLMARPGRSMGSLAELTQKVAVAKGTGFDTMVASLPKARIVKVESIRAGLSKLLAKKVDFIAGEDVGLLNIGRSHGLALIGPSLGKSPLAMAVPKNNVKYYNKLLKKLEPELNMLRFRWSPGQANAPLYAAAFCGENVDRYLKASKDFWEDLPKEPSRREEMLASLRHVLPDFGAIPITFCKWKQEQMRLQHESWQDDLQRTKFNRYLFGHHWVIEYRPGQTSGEHYVFEPDGKCEVSSADGGHGQCEYDPAKNRIVMSIEHYFDDPDVEPMQFEFRFHFSRLNRDQAQVDVTFCSPPSNCRSCAPDDCKSYATDEIWVKRNKQW